MKTTLTVLSLLLNLNTGWAAKLNPKSDLNRNWSYTQTFTHSDKKSVVKVKQFKRYLWIYNKPIQVAETNFTYLQNPQEKVNLKELSEIIKKSFPAKVLTPHNISNGMSLEGEWQKINRSIKIELINKGDDFIVVTSFVRTGLKKALMPEINQLHSLLKTYSNKKEEKKDPRTTFLDFFLPEAHAQSFTLEEITSVINNANITLGTDINANWATTNNNLGAMGTKIDNLNTTIGVNWNETNKQGAEANANWANTNNIMNTQGTNANTNWANTNKIMDKQGTDANMNWAESNKIAAKMMDPNHMAKVAMYTAAGAALGGIVMNLAVEGVSFGISTLYELFTGTKKKKLEWQDFQQAIQSWDSQLSDLVKMEQIVDEFIGAFDFFSDKNIGNDYIKNLNNAMRDMRFDRDIMMAKFKNEELNLGCRRIFYNAADELDQKLKDYEKIIQYATKNNISINKSQNYFCQQLKELQRKILTAETQMQDLRLVILKAERQFYDKNLEAREKREKDMKEINDNAEKTAAQRQEYNQASTEIIRKTYETERAEWITKCMDAENPEGLKIKAEIDNRFIHFFKARGSCTAHFDNNNSLKAREEKAQQILEAENKLRKDLLLKPNDKIDIELSEEQMNWLTRINVDAYCYQFAHVEVSKVPKKCQDFPELLYSMNMSKGYEKAKGAYKDRCEDKYLSGIQKLAEKKD